MPVVGDGTAQRWQCEQGAEPGGADRGQQSKSNPNQQKPMPGHASLDRHPTAEPQRQGGAQSERDEEVQVALENRWCLGTSYI